MPSGTLRANSQEDDFELVSRTVFLFILVVPCIDHAFLFIASTFFS